MSAFRTALRRHGPRARRLTWAVLAIGVIGACFYLKRLPSWPAWLNP